VFLRKKKYFSNKYMVPELVEGLAPELVEG
jgi:hypothetical protein